MSNHVANTNQPVWQNVTNISGTFTNQGGLVFPANGQSLVYDADGNLSFDGVWNYQWDGENRLTSMMMTNVSGIANSNRFQLQFAYDYMGRRVQKIVSSWNGSGFTPQSTNRFVYDGWNLLAIVNLQSSILQSFMWGNDLSGAAGEAGGVGGLLMVSISGTNCFAAYDGNGNVTELINAADKTTSARYEYNPYGELLRATGLLARQNPFRFSTKFWDEESGLVYYGYRYYNPSIGRWISRDPIDEEDVINLYVALLNSPVNQVDTDGRGTFKQNLGAIFTALAVEWKARESGLPVAGAVVEQARLMKMEAQAGAAAAERNLAKSVGSSGGGPPKFYRASGVLWGLALTGVLAVCTSMDAACNLALGIRSERGSAEYSLESALSNYGHGDTAWGDLDAIDAALSMTGGAGEDALVAVGVFMSVGEAFE